MIRINQLKMPLGHSADSLMARAARTLRVRENRIADLKIVKRSVDARKKPEICYSYAVDVAVSGLDGAGEQQLVHRLRDRNVGISQEKVYRCPECGGERLDHPRWWWEPVPRVCSAACCWPERDTAPFCWNGGRTWTPAPVR